MPPPEPSNQPPVPPPDLFAAGAWAAAWADDPPAAAADTGAAAELPPWLTPSPDDPATFDPFSLLQALTSAPDASLDTNATVAPLTAELPQPESPKSVLPEPLLPDGPIVLTGEDAAWDEPVPFDTLASWQLTKLLSTEPEPIPEPLPAGLVELPDAPVSLVPAPGTALAPWDFVAAPGEFDFDTDLPMPPASEPDSLLLNRLPDAWVGLNPATDLPEPDALSAEAAVVFTVAGTDYALPVESLTEITPMPAVTAVPFTPPWVLGVTNLRGDVVGVVDLRVFAGATPTTTRSERLVIVTDKSTDRVCGLVVDGIRGLRRLSTDTMPPPPGPLADFACHAAEIDRQPVIVLDAAKLLANPV